MRTFVEKIQDSFAGVAFAEAGDHETARRLAGGSPAARAGQVSLISRIRNVIDRHLTAATFAEAGCDQMARGYLTGRPTAAKVEHRAPVTFGEFVRTVGLERAPLHFCVATA